MTRSTLVALGVGVTLGAVGAGLGWLAWETTRVEREAELVRRRRWWL